MRSVLSAALVTLIAIASIGICQVESARAMPPFKKAFDTKYVKPDGDDTQKAFAASVKKANCNICHMGKTKKMRNAYGQALDKILEKNEKDPKKIDEALDQVAKEKSKPDDASSPTFGDLIAKGELPAGAPAEDAAGGDEPAGN